MRLARLATVLLLALPLGACGYNQIQSLDEKAEQAKSNVGVQLTARNQLIPNLVATVKGAAEFERGTYTDVAKARAGQAAVGQAEQGLRQAQQQMDQAVQSTDVKQMQSADAAVTRQIGTFINVAREAMMPIVVSVRCRPSWSESAPRRRDAGRWRGQLGGESAMRRKTLAASFC